MQDSEFRIKIRGIAADIVAITNLTNTIANGFVADESLEVAFDSFDALRLMNELSLEELDRLHKQSVGANSDRVTDEFIDRLKSSCEDALKSRLPIGT